MVALLHHRALFLAIVFLSAGCSGLTETITLLPCSFTLSPIRAFYPNIGGLGSVTISVLDSCSWAARSDADWIIVTSASSGRGSGSVTYRIAENPNNAERIASIEVVDADGHGEGVRHQVSQAAPTRLPFRGAYTFVMEVDPDGLCEWPVTTFYWPVNVKVTSYEQGTIYGSIIFPTASTTESNSWSISASTTLTQLIPSQESPGPAGGAYDVVVDGGQWVAGGLTRAHDGRGEITSGAASGAKQILTLRDSGERWECQSDLKWSLLIRFVDED